MAKILNNRNYHKITAVEQTHQRHSRHSRQAETEKEKQNQVQQHQQQEKRQRRQENLFSLNSPNHIIFYNPNQPEQSQGLQQHVDLQAKARQHNSQQHYRNKTKQHLDQKEQLTAREIGKNKKNQQQHRSQQQPASKSTASTYSPASLSTMRTPPTPTTTTSTSSHLLYTPTINCNTNSTSSTTNTSYTTTTNSCCFLTYHLFAAYAEAATLQLKRKTSLNKLFYPNPTSARRHYAMDMNSICYLILMALVYWGVMIKAAVALTPSDNATPASPASMGPMEPLSELITANLSLPNDVVVSGSNNNTNNKSSFHGKSKVNTSSSTISSISMATPSRLQPQQPLPLSPISSSSSSDILTNYQRRLLTRREAANVPDFDDDDSSYHDDEFDEYETLIRNKSAKGKYIGAPCNNMTCEPTLLHVTCDKETQICGCERNYPVQLGLTRGCDKPKKLGEMCFYDETCQYNDENSLCVQVRHNAMCQCANGYHSVSYNKPPRRVFCTQDIDELNSDLPTLLGVCVGIGVLAGLICMVLHLFSKTKYPRHRNFGDANLPPPIMYSSETGYNNHNPYDTVQSGRPSSRSSMRSSGGSIGSYGNRRSSTGGVTSTTAGSKGILVSTSRTGSRRPSLASVHSTSSSVRSYSMMRFEKEQQQKEIRHEMKLRLARLQQHQQQQQLGQYKPQIIIGDTATTMQQHGIALNRITMATPSPMTPNSTDELLPAVDENPEYPLTMEPQTKPCPESVASATLSAIKNAAVSTGTSPKQHSSTTHSKTTPAVAVATASGGIGVGGSPMAARNTNDIANAAYIGPCSSSTEAL
uniref:EB domain-containing protein n=1 Tax=Stomoxys calcitrans TaxID=35570 RepID=A0A1I8PK87_STOCA